MDWVYTATDDDEPLVYEADGLRESRAHVDDASSVTDEPEYFGDDVEDTAPLLAPAEAFARLADELAAGYARRAHAVPRAARNVTVGESRGARIERIQRELDELALEAAVPPDARTESTDGAVFDTLRAQLAALDALSAAPRAGTALVEAPLGDDKAHSVTVSVYAASARDIVELERRVAALERAIGPAFHVDAEGASVAILAKSVRSKLALVDDAGAGAQLRRDAEALVEALKPVAGSEEVKTGAVLARMEEWNGVAAGLPVVIDRLRSLKRLHDDAAGFVNALAKLSHCHDDIKRATQDNKLLLKVVQDGLYENLNTMSHNILALEERINAMR